ncbi:alpha/beta fold hydrolase [Streptomyces graminofaciens]|nr:alpha/beta hydrolase [Streptomyces graminofaciens]
MPSTTGRLTTPDGVHLAYRDHTPPPTLPASGRTLLLLHGLAGHMGEWDDLLPALVADGHRVVMYDARGHGASTRTPADMTRAACVRDAVTVIRELVPESGKLTLVGQSLGGHTAFLAAAEHPALLHSLILIEAGPGAPDPALPAHIAAWLDSWPTPFDSPASATAFFGHEAWSRNLEQRSDGWYPRVDRRTTLAAVAEPAVTSYHSAWAATTCPTLVVRGANGTMAEADATAMPAARAPGTTTRLAVVEDAGHDVHLDKPDRLHATMAEFLNSLGSEAS